MPQYRTWPRIAEVAALMLWSLPAMAQDAPIAQAGADASPAETPAGFWDRANLLGDMGGLRTALGNYGITLGLQNAAETWANATGGIKRGATGNGLATLTLGLDTGKALGWQGGTFNVSLLGIYGPNFSQRYLGNLQTASGIAAASTVRMWELWYQQAFLDGRMDVKVGQQSLDQEFLVSQGASLFVNTAMGWPMTPSADLYAGGPAYPLSSLGARLRGHPTDNITLLGGVFQDNPAGGQFYDDGQLLGATRYGVNMNLRTGALLATPTPPPAACRAPTRSAPGSTPRNSPTSGSTPTASRSPTPRAAATRACTGTITASTRSPIRPSGSPVARIPVPSACSSARCLPRPPRT